MARPAGRFVAALAMLLAAGCAHPGAASEPPDPPTIVDTGSEYLFEFVPPPGWQIPDASVPQGAVRVTVGGALPEDAQAGLMIRALAKNHRSFDEFCESEFASMKDSFPGAEMSLVDVDVPGMRTVSRQIANGSQSAIVTLAEDHGHFVWFGLLVNDPAYRPTAALLFRESVRSYKQTLLSHTASEH